MARGSNPPQPSLSYQSGGPRSPGAGSGLPARLKPPLLCSGWLPAVRRARGQREAGSARPIPQAPARRAMRSQRPEPSALPRLGLPWTRRICWLAICAACQPGCAPERRLPELAEVRLASMSAEARATLGVARDEALRHPQDPGFNGRYAMALQAYELYGEAIAAYRRAAALDGRDWRWPYYAGTAQAALGRHAAAARSFREALALRPDSLAAKIRRAEALLAEERLAESRQLFEETTRAVPASAAAHYGLGRAYDAAGQTEAALGAYLRAAELAPGAGAVRYALALAYQRLGRQADAERHFKAAGGGGREAPSIPDPQMAELLAIRRDKHWQLQEGLRLEAEGRETEAVAAYQRALALDRGYAPPHINLVSAYGKLGQFADAERHYRRALELAPDAVELHVNWGMLQAGRGDFAAAIRSYRRGLEINPHSADLHADLGAVLQRTGQAAEAARHLRLALEREPEHRLANFHLARHLLAEDRVAEAIRHLRRTEAPVDERTPTFLYGLADAYLRAGDAASAARYARRSLDLARAMGQTDLAEAVAADLRALEAGR